MGGPGSGRSKSLAVNYVVEGCLLLDVHDLVRRGVIQRGALAAGGLTLRGPRHVAGGSFRSDARRDMELEIEVFKTAVFPASETRITIRFVPSNIGGLRGQLVCPTLTKAVDKLYLPPGARGFASRDVYRLGYAARGLDRHARERARASKLRRQLGTRVAEPPSPHIPKPRGMHSDTYSRLRACLHATEQGLAFKEVMALMRLRNSVVKLERKHLLVARPQIEEWRYVMPAVFDGAFVHLDTEALWKDLIARTRALCQVLEVDVRPRPLKSGRVAPPYLLDALNLMRRLLDAQARFSP